MTGADHELEFLLSLDGFEFRLGSGYMVKIEAQTIAATTHRPQGIKYSLTLHDPLGQRIYGIDNAHSVRRQAEYDHRMCMDAGKSAATAIGAPRIYGWIFTARWNEY